MKWTTTQVYNHIRRVYPPTEGFRTWQPVVEPPRKPTPIKIEKILCALHPKHNVHIETTHYFEDLTLAIYKITKK